MEEARRKKRVRNPGFDSIRAAERDVPSLICRPLCGSSSDTSLANPALAREKYRSAGAGLRFTKCASEQRQLVGPPHEGKTIKELLVRRRLLLHDVVEWRISTGKDSWRVAASSQTYGVLRQAAAMVRFTRHRDMFRR